MLAQLETPVASTVRAFELARAAGVATLLNAAPAPDLVDPALLALTDILIVNEGEGRAISGHAEALAIGEALARRAGRAAVVDARRPGRDAVRARPAGLRARAAGGAR